MHAFRQETCHIPYGTCTVMHVDRRYGTYMHELDYDALNVITDVASLRESGAVTHHHGNVKILGQRLR